MTDAAQARAIYQLMAIAASADGRIDPAETRVADELVASVPELLEAQSELTAEARALVATLGLDGALSEVAGRLRDDHHRDLAFICCARLIESDGEIAGAEFRVLSVLRRLFAADDARVARLLALADRRV
jgi:hypothetical protein